jgi:hypothetical protein
MSTPASTGTPKAFHAQSLGSPSAAHIGHGASQVILQRQRRCKYPVRATAQDSEAGKGVAPSYENRTYSSIFLVAVRRPRGMIFRGDEAKARFTFAAL